MIWESLQGELDALAADGLQRRRRLLDTPCGPECIVDGARVVSFCSNDYLGFANHPQLVAAVREAATQWGVGSGASHLVSGHLRPHADAEAALAAFIGFPEAVTLSTGYMANLAIVPALVGRGDAVFADKLNHASLIDAVQLSRAESYRYGHGDLDTLAAMLDTSTARRKLILTDAVFSMDGDIAALPHLFELAERHDAWLVIDDAHGFGVLGEEGRGTLSHFGIPAHPRIVLMGTLGKAAGVAGAFIAAAPQVIEWLVSRARSYIFTTAASPLLAAAVKHSVALIAAADTERAALRGHMGKLRAGLSNTRWQLQHSETAIQPLIVGDNRATTELAAALLERGLWVPAIRPPTVPKDSARLRISLSAAHTDAHLDHLIGALRELA